MFSPAAVIIPVMSLIGYLGFPAMKYLHIIFAGIVMFLIFKMGKAIFY